MLKITAIGNLTNDVELKVSETTGRDPVGRSHTPNGRMG
jgi:hypothetical protein